MRLEQALYVSRLTGLDNWGPDFTRLYFGQEFCERLLPSESDLKTAMEFAHQHGAGFTLVTPYVTQAGLGRLEQRLAELDRHQPGAEVVFNDYGVWNVLRARYPALVPVMGRLLNRMKRGPRLMAVIDRLPDTTVQYFRSNALGLPHLQSFLKKRGVMRVELDNLLQGINLPLQGLETSLYYPWAYIATTRLCMTAGCDRPDAAERLGIFPCGRECHKYGFVLENEIMSVPLIRKGNTIFFENEELPPDLPRTGISRIVVEPTIPI